MNKAILIKFPSGRFGFAGCVPALLASVCKDGTPPSERHFADARISGPGFAGLKTRTWDTAEAAKAALAELSDDERATFEFIFE